MADEEVVVEEENGNGDEVEVVAEPIEVEEDASETYKQLVAVYEVENAKDVDEWNTQVEAQKAAEAATEAAQAPAEEAPAEEAPAEEAPVEEAPVAEAPVEEAPVEEAPTEEAPEFASPQAEEAATEAGLTADDIDGTGKDGAVTVADVNAATNGE